MDRYYNMSLLWTVKMHSVIEERVLLESQFIVIIEHY